MRRSVQRRMSQSRRILNRRLRVEPPPAPAETTRPLTDAEQQEHVEHLVDQAVQAETQAQRELMDRR